MWIPTELALHIARFMSNRTFSKVYLIWGMMAKHTVSDLTPGGIYHTAVHGVRGCVEGSDKLI